MGLFSDMKKAHEISADDAISVPAQRIDTLVTDPVSGQQRHRTDYAGTVWYGGLPQIVGGHPLPGRNAEFRTPFWLPDSHGYESGATRDVQVQASAAVQGGMATSAGGNFQILDVAAALNAPDANRLTRQPRVERAACQAGLSLLPLWKRSSARETVPFHAREQRTSVVGHGDHQVPSPARPGRGCPRRRRSRR